MDIIVKMLRGRVSNIYFKLRSLKDSSCEKCIYKDKCSYEVKRDCGELNIGLKAYKITKKVSYDLWYVPYPKYLNKSNWEEKYREP